MAQIIISFVIIPCIRALTYVLAAVSTEPEPLAQIFSSSRLSWVATRRHDATVARLSDDFCRGSIVGARVDMLHGTLELFVNRKPHGVSFYNLRRHGALYPMVCSTAAQSSMRLIYAGSWRASMLVDAPRSRLPQ